MCYVIRLPAFTIATIDVTGTHYADKELVQQAVAQALTGSYAWLVPRRSIALYPSDAIVHAVAHIPAIAHIDIGRESLTALSIAVTERTPSALWCGAATSTECYLMDGDGYVFMKGSEPGLATYRGSLDYPPVGSQYLGGKFATLNTFMRKFNEASGRTPTSVSVDKNGDVFIALAGGGEVRTTLSGVGDALLANVTSVFESSKFKSGATFQYVDFRFGGNVYVKWK